MLTTKRTVISILLAGSLASLPGYAHHSFAMFDSGKVATITGTVKDFQWTNPHVWLDIVVTTQSGEAQTWGIEGGPVAMLKKKGLRPDMVRPGEKIVVRAHPTVDHSTRGSLISISRPDGTMLFEDSGLPN